MSGAIDILGARTHNLKNITVRLPRSHLIAVSGVSGSGKSSLVFDTLYAEGQRRYVESLSTYARQFLERMERPDVDEVRGIAPAVAIEQKNTTRSSRSTVGTATEVHDYLRLLYARGGVTVCPDCSQEVGSDTPERVLEKLSPLREGTSLVFTFPVDVDPIQSTNLARILREKGFYRLWSDGEIRPVEQLKSQPAGTAEVLVDRSLWRGDARSRFMESLTLAYREGKGRARIYKNGELFDFSEEYNCARCQRPFIRPQPRLFSFNNPFGACPVCKGFGDIMEIDEERVIPDGRLSLAGGCILPWETSSYGGWRESLLQAAKRHAIDIDAPYAGLSGREKSIVWDGIDDYPGLHRFFKWLETKKYKIGIRVLLSRYRRYRTCPACGGMRLRPEALNVKIGGFHIGELSSRTIRELDDFFQRLQVRSGAEERITCELKNRLAVLNRIGVGYLALDRRTATLSGGEFQRINLASALGARLVGSIYILDEPTIGLHSRDTEKLIDLLRALRDIGNTVVVVEHDREVLDSSDHLIDLGPGGGEGGGEVVFQGPVKKALLSGDSLTCAYLRGESGIPAPHSRRRPDGRSIVIRGAKQHNLQNIDVAIPLGLLTAITGVSGSGKSTLVHDVLYSGLMKRFGRWNKSVGQHDGLEGGIHIDDVVLVDQSPIGRTPRSNPLTYIKAFDAIRGVFAGTRRARLNGYTNKTFSFNVAGGRCETCAGAGVIKKEMHFLADLYLTCDDCGGRRYRADVLEVRIRGHSIADILEMTIAGAIEFFSDNPAVVKRLLPLTKVGLDYLKCGQPATTLSGGEAQRIKLASHLTDHRRREVLYLFDEPTTGLHFEDVRILLKCFEELLRNRHSVVVIEHNLDVIKYADYVIDLGPEGGQEGGRVVVKGTPEQIAGNPDSHTGRALRKVLS